MSNRYDVVIAGGGMVGATLACALGQEGLRVLVVEAREPKPFSPDQPFDLRVSAVSRGSQNVFEMVNAWQGMVGRRACPFRRMRVWDRDGSGHTEFDSAELAEPRLGHIIENRIIQLALLDRLHELDSVEWRCPAVPQKLELLDDGARLWLDDESCVEADLVVGADGARSAVRQMAGIGTAGWDYDQHALVATVKTRLPQQDITWQRFVPAGPQAFLPLPGPYASMVWYHKAHEVERLKGLDPERFRTEMEAAFPDELGGVEAVLERGSFPLRRMHAQRYVLPGLALVGDAAHTIHPLAGQGVNLGIMDAAQLAEAVVQARARGRAIGSLATLRRYERSRRPANLTMMTAMDGFYRAFGPRSLPVRLGRNLALDIADKVGPIKQVAMRHAMGIDADRPRLARGEPLAERKAGS